MLPSKSVLVLFALAIGLGVAEDKTEETHNKGETSDSKKPFSKECSTKYSATCLKLEIVTWIDKLNEKNEVSVLPGISVVKENVSSDSVNTSNVIAELAREFPNDREARLDAYLMKKISGYLKSHSMKLNLWSSNNLVEEGRGKGGGGGGGYGGGGYGGGGGGGKKGGGGMEYLLAAGAMMKGTLMAMAMSGIAAIAGKALMVGVVSLMMSAIIGLKSLSSGGHKQTTYEIVSKPIYSHANSHSVSHEEHGGGHYGHSGYGRSFDVPLPVTLQPDYKPEP